MPQRRIAKRQCNGRDLTTGSCSLLCINERNNHCNGGCYRYLYKHRRTKNCVLCLLYYLFSTFLVIEDVERGAELSFSGEGDPPLHLRQILVSNDQILASGRQTDRQTDAINIFWAFLVKTPNGKWVRIKRRWEIYILNFFKRDLFVFLSEKYRGLNDRSE